MKSFAEHTTQRLTDSEYDRVQKIALEDAGLMLPDGKRSMVESRLVRRMRKIGCASITEYLSCLSSGESATERRELISVLTTNVTSFFRESHHFQTLRTQVFPSLLQGASAGARVRIWSAGCSSGQEAYSVAMLLKAMDPGVELYDIRILATDIDENVLERGRRAVYPANELESIPEDIRTSLKIIDVSQDTFSIPTEIRQMVSFKPLNLHGEWPMRGRFDVIFCRNVVIYFDALRQAALWPRFHMALNPDGWLFLGHSERIHPIQGSGFVGRGITTYNKTSPVHPKTAASLEAN